MLIEKYCEIWLNIQKCKYTLGKTYYGDYNEVLIEINYNSNNNG